MKVGMLFRSRWFAPSVTAALALVVGLAVGGLWLGRPVTSRSLRAKAVRFRAAHRVTMRLDSRAFSDATRSGR